MSGSSASRTVTAQEALRRVSDEHNRASMHQYNDPPNRGTLCGICDALEVLAAQGPLSPSREVEAYAAGRLAGFEEGAALSEPLPVSLTDVPRSIHQTVLAQNEALEDENARLRAVSPTDGLDELRALSDAATPGPWYDGPEAIIAEPDGVPEAAVTVVYSVELAEPTHDAAFIVAAVNYVRSRLEVTRESE